MFKPGDKIVCVEHNDEIYVKLAANTIYTFVRYTTNGRFLIIEGHNLTFLTKRFVDYYKWKFDNNLKNILSD